MGTALFLLSGCGTVALRRSFENYSDTYADTQNRQMLLNLARLSNREPIYFFQLAQISAGYTFTESVGLLDTKSIGNPNTVANIRTANGTLGGSATHNPVFTLVPLGGDKFATQLLAPIKPAIFYELFEEGWPVDLLMRVLIERIELVNANPGGQASSSKGAGEGLEILINKPSESGEGHYDRFLRACALAREFQKRGILYLDISDKFEPLADNAVFPYPPTDQQQLNANKDALLWKQVPVDTVNLALVQVKDTPEARDTPEPKGPGGGQPEHGSHELAAGNWQLGKNVQQTLFKLNQAALEEVGDELRDPKSVFAGNDDLTGKFRLVLQNGIGVTDTQTSKGSYNVRLVMRSLLGVMLALANEQRTFRTFDEFRHDPVTRQTIEDIESTRAQMDALADPNDIKDESKKKQWVEYSSKLQTLMEKPATQKTQEYIEYMRAQRDALVDPKDIPDESKKKEWAEYRSKLQTLIERAVDTVPESEDHPVLILNWPAMNSIGVDFSLNQNTTVASLTYRNKQYAIADQPGFIRDNKGKQDLSLDTWNRDVFRLIVQLSLQVTADPSTFALPSLLQSH